MTPTLAKSLDNERFLTRLMYLLKHPTTEMIEAGKAAIVESCVTEYASPTAPSWVLGAMADVAIGQAEHG